MALEPAEPGGNDLFLFSGDGWNRLSLFQAAASPPAGPVQGPVERPEKEKLVSLVQGWMRSNGWM